MQQFFTDSLGSLLRTIVKPKVNKLSRTGSILVVRQQIRTYIHVCPELGIKVRSKPEFDMLFA